MNIYYLLVFLLLLFAVMLRGEKKRNTTYIVIAFFLLFCIMGLRNANKIGVDSRFSYRIQFERMENTKWEDLGHLKDWLNLKGDENVQIGESEDNGHSRNIALARLMKLVYDLTDGDYQWFIVIEALIILFSMAFYIWKYSPSPLQSILYYLGLLIFTFEMSALKQAAAMSFLLLSFPSIIDRKPIRFLLLVGIASLFHFPALIFLPAYWICNMRIDRNYLILLAVVFLITYVFRGRLVVLMTETYDTTAINYNSGMRFFANKVIIMLVIIAAALLVRPPEPGDRVYCALLAIMGVAAVIQTFAGYSNNFERLSDYYFQFSVVFIPMVFEGVRTKQKNLDDRTLSVFFQYGPYVFGAFAIWRFLDNIVNDYHFTPFYFFFE